MTTEKALTKIITADEVRKLLVPPGSLQPTDQEVALFIRYCQDKGLNPFIRQTYLIKVSADKPAAIVDAIQTWEAKADDHPQNDGYEAGIIIYKGGKLEYREGSLVLPDERPFKELLGGYATVYRKDRSHPYRIQVSFGESVILKKDGTPNHFWANQPAWQIRNTALRRALKEAYPGVYEGISAEYSPDDFEEAPPTTFKGRNTDRWDAFYGKLRDIGITHEQALEIVSTPDDVVSSLKVWVNREGNSLEKLYDVIVNYVRQRSVERDKKDLYEQSSEPARSEPVASPAGTPTHSQGPGVSFPADPEPTTITTTASTVPAPGTIERKASWKEAIKVLGDLLANGVLTSVRVNEYWKKLGISWDILWAQRDEPPAEISDAQLTSFLSALKRL